MQLFICFKTWFLSLKKRNFIFNKKILYKLKNTKIMFFCITFALFNFGVLTFYKDLKNCVTWSWQKSQVEKLKRQRVIAVSFGILFHVNGPGPFKRPKIWSGTSENIEIFKKNTYLRKMYVTFCFFMWNIVLISCRII